MEGYIPAGFACFVLMYPRNPKHSDNSAAHSKRSIGVVRSYYHNKWGRIPATGEGLDSSRLIRGFIRVLRKLFPMKRMRRIPLLMDDM